MHCLLFMIFFSLQGYLRMAEVYYQTQNYHLAVEAYQKCFQSSANREEKESFFDLSRKCRKESDRQRMIESRYPFLGAAIGILIAVGAVVADFAFYGMDSIIAHPLLKVFVVVVVSYSCHLVASVIRNQMILSRKTVLEPPLDLFSEGKIHTE